MPRMTGQAVSVAANATSANQLAGLLYEFLNRPAQLVLASASSAAGINVTLIAAGVVLINDSPISQANRFPIIPDDVSCIERVPAGRLILTFRNTTGGALTVNWLVDLT